MGDEKRRGAEPAQYKLYSIVCLISYPCTQPELSFAARELTNLPVCGSSSHMESLNSKNRHHVTVPSVLIICIKSVFH